jgi:triphosphoribosyl-dephospho-CoA synthase
MERIAQIAQMACVLEVCAPKPGNVNRLHNFSDTSLEDFLLSAVAIGPAFENAARSGVGQIIRQAAIDTHRLVRSNTNLGMILLLAPLAKAGMVSDTKNLRQNLRAILESLNVEDARLAYDAIRLVHPGGLGAAPNADVAEEPSITLIQAMALAQTRDSIAREYVTGFEIGFDIGLPALREASSRGSDFSSAVVHAFLNILSTTPDTLIARKMGIEIAQKISRRASGILEQGGVFTARGQAALADMDRELRDPGHTLNPGTTADLTASAIFLFLFQKTSSPGIAGWSVQLPKWAHLK